MNPASLRLESKKAVLRAPLQSDIPHLVRWFSDPEILQLTAETERMTPRRARAFLETVRKDPDRAWFIIVDKATGKPVGECGLLRIFRPWRTADLTMIIGEKDCWGKGVSDEAMGLLLELAFGKLGLHRLSVGVLETNVRAIRFYGRHGFREEGRQRDGHLAGGKYRDFVMMSLLEDGCRVRVKKTA